MLDGAGLFGYEFLTETDPWVAHTALVLTAAILEKRTMHIATNAEVRSQKGAKALALACFAIAAGLLIASLFVPSPARAGKTGHPPVQTAMP
jgi:hypothetical protein